MMSTSGGGGEVYGGAKTSVWWDIENCEVPRGSDAHLIAQNVGAALAAAGYTGPVSISAYGDTSRIPHLIQHALSSTGVELHHVPAGIKDASDKKILVDMLFWAIDNPPPANYLLISGDRDFCNALHKLRMRRYNILLAQPSSVSQPLVAAAKSVWHWKSLVAGEPPLAESPYISCVSSHSTSDKDSSRTTCTPVRNIPSNFHAPPTVLQEQLSTKADKLQRPKQVWRYVQQTQANGSKAAQNVEANGSKAAQNVEVPVDAASGNTSKVYGVNQLDERASDDPSTDSRGFPNNLLDQQHGSANMTQPSIFLNQFQPNGSVGSNNEEFSSDSGNNSAPGTSGNIKNHINHAAPPNVVVDLQKININGKVDIRTIPKPTWKPVNQNQANGYLPAKQAAVQPEVSVANNSKVNTQIQSEETAIPGASGSETGQSNEVHQSISPSGLSVSEQSPVKSPVEPVSSTKVEANPPTAEPHKHVKGKIKSVKGVNKGKINSQNSGASNNRLPSPQGLVDDPTLPYHDIASGNYYPAYTYLDHQLLMGQKYNPSFIPHPQYVSEQAWSNGPQLPSGPPTNLPSQTNQSVSYYSHPSFPSQSQSLYPSLNNNCSFPHSLPTTAQNSSHSSNKGSAGASSNKKNLTETILRALQILKAEKLAPSEVYITDCIRYSEINMPTFNVKKALVGATAQGIVVKCQLGPSLPMYIPKYDTLWKCVNIMDGSAKYPEEDFNAIQKFLASISGRSSFAASQCRYQAAVLLKKNCVSQYVLGDIMQIIHIIVGVKKWIVPHLSGWQPLTINIPADDAGGGNCATTL